MATTPVELKLNSGRGGATVDIFPRGSDTAAVTARAITERTNGLGIYSFNVAEVLTGWHTLHIKTSSGRPLAVFDVYLHDTTAVHLAEDAPYSLTENDGGLGPDAEADVQAELVTYGGSTHSAADVDALITASHGAGSYLTADVSGLSTFDPTTDAVFIDGTKQRLDDLNDITVGDILAATIDGGVDLQLCLAAILATILGETNVVGDVVSFIRRDGSTDVVSVQLSSSVAGKRVASSIVGE